MKTKFTIILMAFALGVSGVTAPPVQAAKKKDTNYGGLLAASEIKGTKVKNLQNQEIGDIDEVLIDPDSGAVRFAVLNVGGFLGLGATKVAVPWDAFQLTRENGKPRYVLDATKERLQKAPRVEGKHYERLYTKADAEPVYVYWHVAWIEPVGGDTSATSSYASTPNPTASP
jgi:sporulation protein YlmC with PRC-barrel domain